MSGQRGCLRCGKRLVHYWGGSLCTKCEASDVTVQAAQTTTQIVDEEYEPGVPGRACLGCHSAWPANEPDGAYWHHADGCAVGGAR